MSSKGRALRLAAAVVAAGLLSGCEEAEQDRILLYEKGSYLGKPDTPISAETRDALRQRTWRQHSE